MRIERRFTRQGQSAYATIEFRKALSEIKNPDGSVVFRLDDIDVPAQFSQVAADILAQKYFRKAGVPARLKKIEENNVPSFLWHSVADEAALAELPESERYVSETDARQVFDRLAGTWTYWGWKGGYFNTEEDAAAFRDELAYMLATQRVAPNSPQWFNTGLHWAYGIDGPGQGHFYVDPFTGKLTKSKSAYEHPQPHACFIQGVEDDLVNEGGIMDLWVREARLFKYGSGTGSNFSNLRGEGERLSGGGKSSGLMSFLKIGDRAAGAIKSGGTTRRAAKMVIVDADHPDVEAFIDWKVKEEQKVASLVAGSKMVRKHLEAIMRACVNCEGADDDCFDPAINTALKREIKAAKKNAVPENYIQRVVQFARQGYTSIEFPTYDTDWDSEAYLTVSGQNSNNSVSLKDDFLRAVEKDESWSLIRRIDGKVHKTIPARDLWEKIGYAAWASADPGLHFNTTMNDWHTCAAAGAIRASNPCSEYMFLDDTACNLASINLLPYRNGDGSIDIAAYEHTVRLWTIVLEISVMMAQFPSKEIAKLSYEYRTLGLGYANIGGLLMTSGIPYDSDEGRALCGALTALMTGVAYATSAEMAGELGAFPDYDRNAANMLRVMRNHRRAAYGVSGEGWFDAHAYLHLFRRALRTMDVDFVTASVTGIERRGARVTSVALDNGDKLEAGIVVDAAGPNAGKVAAMAGLDLPVEPRKRNVFVFEARERYADMPLLVDPSGIYVRPEGSVYITGGAESEEGETAADPADFEPDWPLFENEIWPVLATRIPAFEAIKMTRAWVGHYDYNVLDQNAVIGPHPEVTNFLFANGFSGHGLQQAPAVGRALAELVVHGGYRSIDCSAFGYGRVAEGRAFRELNVI